MKRTIALTLICKNEAHNLPRLLKSVSGCFDKIYICDTGSTDGTLEYLNSPAPSVDSNTDIYFTTFDWIDDFSAARNFIKESATEDYWMWMDCDDVLGNAETFKLWKKTVMPLMDVWFLPYNYAFDGDNPVISFIRERVFKTSLKSKWVDPVHECVDFSGNENPSIKAQGCVTWTVDHRRSMQDAENDKGRNIAILEKNKTNLSTRLKYYLGKEYFDAQRFEECIDQLIKTLALDDLCIPDRILAYQYVTHACLLTGKYDLGIKNGSLGIQLDPTRAELHCLVGDTYIQMREFDRAIPYYKAATGCIHKAGGMSHTFSFADTYGPYPKLNMAKIMFSQGNFHGAIEELNNVTLPEALQVVQECNHALKMTKINVNLPSCDDIVITCPPNGCYKWDEETYKTHGLGGSETAAVEMAKWLHKLTGRRVKVFNERDSVLHADSGVEYHSFAGVHDYFLKWKPKLHVAWRHTARFTAAHSVVWAHDLVTQGLENLNNYDKVLALSEFSKELIQVNHGVSGDRVLLTRNGIDPDRFKQDIKKEYGKIIFPSSPDRGLVHAIKILELVRKDLPDVKLHAFYGFDNLLKHGRKAEVDAINGVMAGKDWINFVGNVPQSQLTKEFMSSQVWLYPADFIETYCIGAIEALCSKVYPITRDIGALPYTLGKAHKDGMCDILDAEVDNYRLYADRVIEAIELRKYDEVNVNPDDYSWESVAREWIEMFDL